MVNIDLKRQVIRSRYHFNGTLDGIECIFVAELLILQFGFRSSTDLDARDTAA